MRTKPRRKRSQTDPVTEVAAAPRHKNAKRAGSPDPFNPSLLSMESRKRIRRQRSESSPPQLLGALTDHEQVVTKKEKPKALSASSSSTIQTKPLEITLCQEYVKIAEQLSVPLSEEECTREKKLLILDLNGTLVSRNQKTAMFVRPHQDQFINYIFDHFNVMVWSSAQPKSVTHMCRLFGERRKELVRIWNRTHFNLTPEEYKNKSVTIKDLRLVWKDLRKFNATNTILLDDSPKKAVCQPYNSIHLRTFNHKSSIFHKHGERELLDVIDYLETLRSHSNVCSFIKQNPFVSTDPESIPHEESNFCTYHYVFNDPPTKRKLESFVGRPKASVSTQGQ